MKLKPPNGAKSYKPTDIGENFMYTSEELQMLYSYAWDMYIAGNYMEAFDAFKKLYDFEHAEATYMLGIMYLYCYFIGVDYSKAIAYLQLAGERGYSPAFRELVKLYRDGYEIEPDNQKAIEYERKVSDYEKNLRR